MNKLLSILFAVLLFGCTDPTQTGEFRGAVNVGETHPEITYIINQLEKGQHTNILKIDSPGGSTDQWRKLAELSDNIGMVVLNGDCNSACLLFAITVSAKGVPVYTTNNGTLLWHGQISSNPNFTQNEQQFDTLMWMIIGLPTWACDIENSLWPGKTKDMTIGEYNKAGFRKYQ